ncbi:hypothetical protein P879_02200 [Paragonimus westermani]|uniref:Uncharacterized protein n=1 Tax=Paragonimus westermani TaxID=34504 RepID=A0A8T0DWJ3_9TREM|nr:hypothetical protein P879_02200 [Paragonimus westermani]
MENVNDTNQITSHREQKELLYQLSLIPYVLTNLRKFESQVAEMLTNHCVLPQELSTSMNTILTIPSWFYSDEPIREKIRDTVLLMVSQMQQLSGWLESYSDHIQQMLTTLHRMDEKIRTFMMVVGVLEQDTLLTGA